MELEFFRGAPVAALASDRNSLMKVARTVSRRDLAKRLGIGSDAQVSVLAETGK